MLDIDDAIDHNANAARLRYVVPGLALRISDLTDVLGGYACNVVEVEGRTVWIDLPIRRDGMLDLVPGQLVACRFDRPGDAAYLFDSVVADVRPDDHAPFGLAMPVTVNRRSHRADARLALVLDAVYEVDGVRGEGKVVDLSAGGLGLICESELSPGDEVVVRCTLPGPDADLALEQRAVVRAAEMYGRTPGGATLHQYGCKFATSDEDLREQILASVIWNLTRNPAVL